MSAAASTPRVRTLVICDEAIASKSEDGVYSLKGVRYEAFAPSFPCQRSLSLYLLLTSSQEGNYSFRVRIVDDSDTCEVYVESRRVGFAEANDPVALAVDLGKLEFPSSGRYLIQIWFVSPIGSDVLKGEQTLRLIQSVE